MRKQKGFSLIELLIVVAIILIIAAIAVPNLLRAKISANEASAVGAERTIASSSILYQTSYSVYPSTMANLGPNAATGCTSAVQATSCLIDWSLSNAITAANAKSGYVFTFVGPISTAGVGFTSNADAATEGTTGVRHFYVDGSCVIRANAAGSATVSSTAI